MDHFNEPSKLWEKLSTLKSYDWTLATVFDIALGELDDDARTFLEILVFLNPDEVPEEILRIKEPAPELSLLDEKNQNR